jgi:hypothetical protein
VRTNDFWEFKLMSASAEGNVNSDATVTAIDDRHMIRRRRQQDGR